MFKINSTPSLTHGILAHMGKLQEYLELSIGPGHSWCTIFQGFGNWLSYLQMPYNMKLLQRVLLCLLTGHAPKNELAC